MHLVLSYIGPTRPTEDLVISYKSPTRPTHDLVIPYTCPAEDLRIPYACPTEDLRTSIRKSPTRVLHQMAGGRVSYSSYGRPLEDFFGTS